MKCRGEFLFVLSHFSQTTKIGRNPKIKKSQRRDCFYYFIYLCNCVFALDDGQDSFLLDGGWFFETEGIDASQHFFLEPHVVKIINFQIPVRFETFFSFLSCKNKQIALARVIREQTVMLRWHKSGARIARTFLTTTDRPMLVGTTHGRKQDERLTFSSFVFFSFDFLSILLLSLSLLLHFLIGRVRSVSNEIKASDKHLGR